MTTGLDPRFDTLIWSFMTIIFIAVGSYILGNIARYLARSFGATVAEQRRTFWGVLFASPWILGFIIFVVGPALASFYWSFTDYKLGQEASWVGLENYRELLLGQGAHGRRFSQAMYNSFYYAIVGVPLQVTTALLMAVLLNQALKGISVFRLIFYIPVILAGGPAILLAWRYMLSSNGGFINTSLSNLASSFFLFDWLYRGFIYIVETLNSFYAGVAKGDPIGPFKFAIPALLGASILYTLVRGEWDENKRGRAMLVTEIIGLVMIVLMFARAIVAEPVEPALFYGVSLIFTVGIFYYAQQKEKRQLRIWQVSGVIAFASFLALLIGFETPEVQALYLPAVLISLLPIMLSFFLLGLRVKNVVLLGSIGVLVALIFARLAPIDLFAGKVNILGQYLTFQSSLVSPYSLETLQNFDSQHLPALWLYGALALGMGVIGLWNNRHPKAQRAVIIGLCVFFGIIALNATIDGFRYFRAYPEVAEATSKPNYHFALFNNTVTTFPDSNRVPLWLGNELWSKPSLILITMWSSGAGMLIFLAALKGVPKALYEAAEVDGASATQKFFRITLPMISPAMFYNVVIGIIAAIQTFESIYIIRNTQTQDSLASAAIFLYERTFRQLAIGDGAAVSWILAAIIILLTVFQFRFSRWVHYEA